MNHDNSFKVDDKTAKHKCKNNKEGVPSYALNHLDGLEKHPFYQKRRSIKIEYKIQQTHFFKPFMMHTI